MSKSTDKAPFVFAKHRGALYPVNHAAKDLMTSIRDGTQVNVKVTRMTANQKRRAFYFVMLHVAAEKLKDATERPWDAELLHDTLKETLRLGETWETPSGKKIFKKRSTSDRAMSEPDRARWTDRCAETLSTWLQVPMKDLMDEARRQHGAIGF